MRVLCFLPLIGPQILISPGQMLSQDNEKNITHKPIARKKSSLLTNELPPGTQAGWVSVISWRMFQQFNDNGSLLPTNRNRGISATNLS